MPPQMHEDLGELITRTWCGLPRTWVGVVAFFLLIVILVAGIAGTLGTTASSSRRRFGLVYGSICGVLAVGMLLGIRLFTVITLTRLASRGSSRDWGLLLEHALNPSVMTILILTFGAIFSFEASRWEVRRRSVHPIVEHIRSVSS